MLLRLDHFYTDLPEEIFRNLVPLVNFFEPAIHHRVVREDMTYEGLYFFSKQGQYLELLKEDLGQHNYTAVVLSPSNPDNFGIEVIRTRFDQYNWITSDLIKTPDDKPWFRTHAPKENREVDRTVRFVPWIMEYENHDRNRVYQLQKNPKIDRSNHVIEQFLSLHFDVSTEIYNEILHMAPWITDNMEVDDNQIELRISNPNGKKIRFYYKKQVDLKGLNIKSVEMELNKELEFERKRIGIIEILSEGTNCKFIFDTYHF